MLFYQYYSIKQLYIKDLMYAKQHSMTYRQRDTYDDKVPQKRTTKVYILFNQGES